MAENERGEMLARKNQAKRGASPRALKRKAALERGQEALATWLDLPTDVMLDWPRVSLLGRRQLYIENHKGISAYGDERVCVATTVGTLVVVGKRLALRDIAEEEIVVTGEVEGISYVR